MAFRKETIKRQFSEARAAHLEPGEAVVAESFTIAGPTPWLMGGVGFLIMYLLGTRYYFMTVTDRRVMFMTMSLWTGKPRGFAFALPRGSVAVESSKRARLWSSLRLTRANEKPLRLNFHRIWRDEFDQIVSVLQPAGAAPMPPAPPA